MSNDALVERLLGCSVAIGLDDDRAAELRPEMRRRCASMVDAYSKGLAALFARLNGLDNDRANQVVFADRLGDWTVDVVRAMHGDAGDTVVDALQSAARSRTARAAHISRDVQAEARSETTRRLQRQFERGRQPVFACAALRKQQDLAAGDTALRDMGRSRCAVAQEEPRLQLNVQDAISLLNSHFGVKHMHRPCRAAAGAPFDQRGVRWHAVRLVGGAALRRVLGVADCVALQIGRCDAGVTVVPLGGDVQPAARTRPAGNAMLLPGSVCEVETLLTHGELRLPRAALFETPKMLGMGGHAKSISVRVSVPHASARAGLLIVAPSPRRARCERLVQAAGGRFCFVAALPAPAETAAAAAAAAVAAAAADNAPAPAATARWCAFGPLHLAAVHMPPGRALETARDIEAVECQADFAALWLPGEPGMVALRARVPRNGDRADEHAAEAARWYTGTPRSARFALTAATWTQRGICAWDEVLRGAGLRRRDDIGITARREHLDGAVRALADPLRWYTWRAAAALHPHARLTPVPRAQTAPSCMTEQQQYDLAAAEIWQRFGHSERLVRESRRLLRIFHTQIGRYAVLQCDGHRHRSGAAPSSPRGTTLWQQSGRTSARTLNCAYPDAPAGGDAGGAGGAGAGAVDGLHSARTYCV